MALVTVYRLWHGLSHDICLAWETAREFIIHLDPSEEKPGMQASQHCFHQGTVCPGALCFPACTVTCQGRTISPPLAGPAEVATLTRWHLRDGC